jgi:hypothetical protein
LAFLMLLFSNCAQYLSFLESSRTFTLSMILNLPVSLILEWIRSLSSGFTGEMSADSFASPPYFKKCIRTGSTGSLGYCGLRPKSTSPKAKKSCRSCKSCLKNQIRIHSFEVLHELWFYYKR